MTSRRPRSKCSPSSRKPVRKHRSAPRVSQSRRVALAEMKDDLPRYLRMAASEEIVITRHGRPEGVLIGFETEEDWFEYRLEHHPEFLSRAREARAALAQGKGVRLEQLTS